MAWWRAAAQKLAVNTASSAAGTGAVLGLHNALAPAEVHPQVLHSFQPSVHEAKGLVNLDLEGGSASILFYISAVFTVLGLLLVCCSGCSPRYLYKKRQEKRRYQELMERTNEIQTQLREQESRGNRMLEQDVENGPQVVQGDHMEMQRTAPYLA